MADEEDTNFEVNKNSIKTTRTFVKNPKNNSCVVSLYPTTITARVCRKCMFTQSNDADNYEFLNFIYRSNSELTYFRRPLPVTITIAEYAQNMLRPVFVTHRSQDRGNVRIGTCVLYSNSLDYRETSESLNPGYDRFKRTSFLFFVATPKTKNYVRVRTPLPYIFVSDFYDPVLFRRFHVRNVQQHLSVLRYVLNISFIRSAKYTINGRKRCPTNGFLILLANVDVDVYYFVQSCVIIITLLKLFSAMALMQATFQVGIIRSRE